MDRAAGVIVARVRTYEATLRLLLDAGMAYEEADRLAREVAPEPLQQIAIAYFGPLFAAERA